MTFDDAIDAFIRTEVYPGEEIQWVLEAWDSTGPICRAMLHDYVEGIDLSERTEQALISIVYLLGEKMETASFTDVCRLAMDDERRTSIFGEDDLGSALQCLLISTFDGNRELMYHLVESPAVDEYVRGDVLISLAYLTRTRRLPEAETYEYLATLPDRLQPAETSFVWAAWVSTIAALGFAGLSSRVEQVFRQGLVDEPATLSLADFWSDLRESQEDPHGVSGGLWRGIGPIGRAIDWLSPLDEAEASDWPSLPEPVRNPLRHVGRNDPCPCGSGKKYKKCCLNA